ncbi:hypothetical protein [Hyalangium minutum]|uniref:Cytochrome c domain-containing protein n=1 Tax=Hyalangium minutum TaxID=394096 RepID=A0A085WL06_9BACT|nr:hypothetical protein [Hyalangium minutum]KFE68369.1 hypothetical protein DB31_7606 [Hyalangium minutum]
MMRSSTFSFLFEGLRAQLLTVLLTSSLLAACSSDTPVDPLPPQPNVPCAGLQTGLESGKAPATLSETGLFQDISTRSLAAGVREFSPRYALWSDAAVKRRYVQLPDGCQIDTSDMDHWVLPVGARLWKDFTAEGKLVETRFIARYGTGPKDFILGAYAWRADGSDADYVAYGQTRAQGTGHDIPAAKTCKTCHSYLSEQALGFSALQLSHEGSGVTLSTLVQEGRLTVAPAAAFKAPGNSVESAALGYLHANCGNCHNSTGIEFNNPFSLRLSVKDVNAADTDTYRTGIGVAVEKFATPGITRRIDPGNPQGSCVYHRMTIRGTEQQMPPTASHLTDPEGLALISEWISSMR